METWLVDVKRVRIPRPKFGSTSGGSGRCYPTEPPKDYVIYDDIAMRHGEMNFRAALQEGGNSLAKATEDLRRAFQEKL